MYFLGVFKYGGERCLCFFSVEMAEFIMQFYDNSVDSSGEFLFSSMYFKLPMIV